MSGLWKAPATLRAVALNPAASAALRARSQAALEPLTTIWPGAL
jgi:hypothetical protein